MTESVLKAKSMGLETHVFAWAAGDIGEKTADYFYPVSIVEKEQILSVCRQIGIDGICSIASDLAMLTVNYVADAMGLVGNSPECTKLSTNKASMREAFAKCGDPSPKYFVIRQDDNANEPAIKEQMTKLNFPLIVKPVDRSGSRGVTLVSDEAELLPAIENARLQGFSGDVIIESFIHGKEYSVECLSCRGVHTLLQITEKFTTGTPHFIETGHKEPALLPPEVRQKAEAPIRTQNGPGTGRTASGRSGPPGSGGAAARGRRKGFPLSRRRLPAPAAGRRAAGRAVFSYTKVSTSGVLSSRPGSVPAVPCNGLPGPGWWGGRSAGPSGRPAGIAWL